MREYSLTFSEALQRGLKQYLIPGGAQVLQNCLGFRCGRHWLEGYDELDSPIPAAIDMHYNWPFPQFIAGKSVNLMIVRDNVNQEDVVYVVSDDHATVTEVFAVDKLTFGVGGRFDVADFGEYVLTANGVVMLYYDSVADDWVAGLGFTNIPHLGTVCNFNGQMVGGCVLSTWHDCDENFVVWSKIGSADFTPDRFNTAGYRRDPYGGYVHHVRKIGEKVAIYSSKGVSFMFPANNAFGFKRKEPSPIVNRGAVDGTEELQIYVDDDYVVRQVTEQEVKELGYESYISQLSGEDIIVNYEPVKKNFYIGNSSKTFLLTENGMTEIRQHPSAVWRIDGTSYMLPDDVDSDLPYIQTNKFDMGYRGEKTIFTVESDAVECVSPEAMITWSKVGLVDANTDYITMNDQGIAPIIISGNDFAATLRFTTVYPNSRIGYITVRYKMTDLKNLRGVYSPPPRGQYAS